jgi:hypothetical protein
VILLGKVIDAKSVQPSKAPPFNVNAVILLGKVSDVKPVPLKALTPNPNVAAVLVKTTPFNFVQPSKALTPNVANTGEFIVTLSNSFQRENPSVSSPSAILITPAPISTLTSVDAGTILK